MPSLKINVLYKKVRHIDSFRKVNVETNKYNPDT